MVDQGLLKLGTELSEFKFNGFLDWFVHVSDIRVHWKYEPTYLIAQAAFLLGGLVTFIHAVSNKGRLPWLWLGLILHGLIVESITYIHPNVDNFWHSQTPIMFLGRRLPLHIIFLYPSFLYQAQIAAAKLKLSKWAEPFVVGLLVVLIDLPYDIVSVKYVHWTWHDTDPNIQDRHYWVPWNSYFFHSTFAAGFVFWFHFLRKLFCSSEGKWVADKRSYKMIGIREERLRRGLDGKRLTGREFYIPYSSSLTTYFKELICTVLTALLGAPTGILGFLIIYHPLHDLYNIHSEISYFIVFAIYALIAWSGDRQAAQTEDRKNSKLHWSSWLTLFHLVFHYAAFMSMLLFFKPENEVSTGLKEPIGPCNEYVPQHTIFGMILSKRKYLCATDYDESYFDFHCLPNKKVPSDGSIWYTICGTPFENRAEYIVIISLVCFIAIGVFRNLYFKSSGDSMFVQKASKSAKDDKHLLRKKKK